MKEVFQLKLADELFEIHCRYASTKEFCKEYLINEDTQKQSSPIIITMTEQDIIFERKRSESEAYSNQYLETLAVYRKAAEQLIERDVLLFHGSAIAVNGMGYLFTAKSGTGKSTHTRLWREEFGEKAFMVNDDKPLLRITPEGVTVYGTPWDGKHRLSRNTSVPLKAICIIRQEKENHIEHISGQGAYAMLLQQTYRSADPLRMAKTLNLLDKLIQRIEFYELGCNMEAEAAVIAYEGMQKGKEI